MNSPIWILAAALAVGASSPAENEIAPGGCGAELAAGGGQLGPGMIPAEDTVEVWGKPVEVPELKLQATEAGAPMRDARLSVCYDWRWYSYPYPETLFGAWEINYECRSCRLAEGGSATVPPHQIEPRGWYNGWLLFGRKPSFVGLRFEISSGGYSYSLSHVTPKQLGQLKEGRIGELRLQNADIEVTISVAAPTGNSTARDRPR